MESQEKSKAPVFIGLFLFVGTGLIAFFILFGGTAPPPPGTVVKGSPSQTAPALPPSALLAEEMQRRDEEDEAARRAASGTRMMIQRDDMTSELLARGRKPRGQQGAAAPSPEEPRAPRRTIPRAEQAGGYEEAKEGWSMIKLSAAEQAQLDAIGANFKTPNEAEALAANPRMFEKVIGSIGRSPKLTKYLLDNEFIVKGFMGRPRSRQNCSNKAAAVKHYSDPSNGESGVALRVLNEMLKGNSETPSAFGSSKMMGAMLKCPGLQGIINDPDALSTIMDKNPIASQMLQDPAILKGMMGSPDLMQAYMGAQSGLQGR